MQYNEVGLDGGEFAPWNEGELGEAIRRTETMLFGQEKRPVECEIVGGRPLQSECGDAVNQLELTGGTSNGKSLSATGLYAEYGLTGAERIAGVASTDLEEGQKADVTIETQPAKEGVVPRITRGVGTAFGRAGGAFEDAIDVESSSESPSSSSSSNGEDQDHPEERVDSGPPEDPRSNDDVDPSNNDPNGETDDEGGSTNDEESSSDESSFTTMRVGVGIMP